jgi:hypothetical protein
MCPRNIRVVRVTVRILAEVHPRITGKLSTLHVGKRSMTVDLARVQLDRSTSTKLGKRII